MKTWAPRRTRTARRPGLGPAAAGSKASASTTGRRPSPSSEWEGRANRAVGHVKYGRRIHTPNLNWSQKLYWSIWYKKQLAYWVTDQNLNYWIFKSYVIRWTKIKTMHVKNNSYKINSGKRKIFSNSVSFKIEFMKQTAGVFLSGWFLVKTCLFSDQWR